MERPYKLQKHKCRFVTILPLYSDKVPGDLFYAAEKKPDLTEFPYPLPSAPDSYTCEAVTADGIHWYGSPTGVTAYDPAAERASFRVMYFSAQRYLPDNEVKSMYADGTVIWVQCRTGVARIEMQEITCEEKAKLLLAETRKAVDRRGMVTDKHLNEPRNIDSAVSYGHSDNDGCFTAAYAIGEMFHYAYCKREKGPNAPDTMNAKALAYRACEACLLLMYISGRGDGFVARTYLAPDEPLPDDGLFFEKQEDGTAVCLNTNAARERGMVGMKVKAGEPVPARLARLYRSLGYSDAGIRYKGDTSSDELTLHFLNMMYAYDLLCDEDEELRELIVTACRNLMNHIIDNGYMLLEADGKPTTWARWNPGYFATPTGWADACLNAAELLMYLKVTMHITGEAGKWQQHYNKLIKEYHYDELPLLHLDRFTHMAYSFGNDCAEELMYGDNMLAVCAFWGLIGLEDDPVLKEKYRKALRTWDHTLLREVNPGYLYPCKLVCPDYPLDEEAVADWFYHNNVSRLEAGINMVRRDQPRRTMFGGGYETSWLMQPDELPIDRYDRNYNAYFENIQGDLQSVESCYVYTFAYWLGKYYGFID